MLRYRFRKANAPTLIVNFIVQPSWKDLASNITEEFKIPSSRVGVVFVNEAKATFTITDEEELQKFYKSLNQSYEEIKFVVQDLATPDPESIIQSGKQSAGSDDELRLFCWILGSDGPFSVKIGKGETVNDLKTVIKKKNEHTLAGIDDKTLAIWKLSPPIHSFELDKNAQTLKDIEG
ncbi:hypothetical protein M378DRAFT_26883 [Amanita muscaria Koide BX008]|uniref:Crinkler effector protein N-terminal domain-containing protein n=1 Tax=Amanita muscaria (strain Koide BX008) TaxID=946122 RepID=A0A0C2WE29_AMAMK|nr:hypothetical protein M378DRAFT_26883 [Amanita muscaria Koide BX008]